MNLFLYTPDFDEAIATLALSAIPRFLPTAPLNIRVELLGERVEQGYELCEVPNPAPWIVARMDIEGPALLSNGLDEDAYVDIAAHRFPAPLVVVREPLFQTTITFPESPDYIAGASALLRALGPAMRAPWGKATTR